MNGPGTDPLPHPLLVLVLLRQLLGRRVGAAGVAGGRRAHHRRAVLFVKKNSGRLELIIH